MILDKNKERQYIKTLGTCPCQANLNDYIDTGWLIVCTDGSSKKEDVVGWVGGWGVSIPQPGIMILQPKAKATDRLTLQLSCWLCTRFREGMILIATD